MSKRSRDRLLWSAFILSIVNFFLEGKLKSAGNALWIALMFGAVVDYIMESRRESDD